MRPRKKLKPGDLKNLFNKTPQEEDFEYKYRELLKIYDDIFYDELKDTAESIGLSNMEWRELVSSAYRWDYYTDFFSRLSNEYRARLRQNYYDLSDLYNPNTGDLKSQITGDVIKNEWVFTNIFMKYLVDHEQYNFFRDLVIDYPKLKNIYDNDGRKEYVISKFPYEKFKNLFVINISEDEIKKYYMVLTGENVNGGKPSIGDYFPHGIYEESLDGWCSYTLSFELLKNLGDEKKLEELIEKYSEELTNYFMINQVHNLYDLPMRRPFDEFFIKFYDKYRFDLDKNETFRKFYYQYTRRKFNLFNKGDLIDRFSILETVAISNEEEYVGEIEKYSEKYWKKWKDENRELIYGYSILNSLIDALPHESEEYQILEMLKIIYFEIWEREDGENYLQEILYRCKKISNKEFLWKDAVKDYITSILSIGLQYPDDKDKFLNDFGDSISEIFGKEYLEYLKYTFIPKKYKVSRKNIGKDRSAYKIGLIFGDSRSKRAYELFSNDKKNDKVFSNAGVTRKQFTTLAEEFYEQQGLDISSKINSGKIDFVLIFETDHTTPLIQTFKAYPRRVTICNHPKQHFSGLRFENMLNEGIGKYEEDISL